MNADLQLAKLFSPGAAKSWGTPRRFPSNLRY